MFKKHKATLKINSALYITGKIFVAVEYENSHLLYPRSDIHLCRAELKFPKDYGLGIEPYNTIDVRDVVDGFIYFSGSLCFNFDTNKSSIISTLITKSKCLVNVKIDVSVLSGKLITCEYKNIEVMHWISKYHEFENGDTVEDSNLMGDSYNENYLP